jgi:beta-lactamase regulating signal transducer with metallopeptidase domain/protocatechuate 3,4-dioxygenase beta subunit
MTMLGRILVEATVEATLFLLLACAAAWSLRRSSAAVRHRVWSVALCGLIVLPGVSRLVPAWQLPILPGPVHAAAAPPAELPAPAPVAEAALPTPSPSARAELAGAGAGLGRRASRPTREVGSVAVVGGAPREAGAGSTRGGSRPWKKEIVPLVAWGIGFSALALPTVIGLIAAEWHRRRARLVVTENWRALLDELRRTLGIRRAVALCQGGSAIPLTWGVFRPVILLPEEADAWAEALRRAVLLHELAHVQRLDALFQLIGRVAAAMYWFHPLAWYALIRLRVECECACDDGVVHAGERPAKYAEQLLDLARSLRRPGFSAAVAMARRNSNALERRLVALFDAGRSHAPLDRRAGEWLWAIGMLLVWGVAAVQVGPPVVAAGAPPAQAQPLPQPEPEPEPQPAPKVAGNPPGRISGRVVLDEEGTAAVGATVVLLPPPEDGSYYYVKYPLRRAEADGNGAFAFDGLAPGKYNVWANLGKLTSKRDGDRGLRVVLPEAGDAPGPVSLRLRAGLALTVRVKDKATGKPIPNATVRLLWSDFATDPTTDGEGVVVLQPLTASQWKAEVWADGHAIEARSLNLENGSDAETEFLLGSGGALEGIVRDASGTPLAGVGVGAREPGGVYPITGVKTDENGHYRLEHLPRDVPLEIGASKTDYTRTEVTTRVTGLVANLDLTVAARPRGGSIAGVVRDSEGRPIAGAELMNTGMSSDEVRTATTGPEGRFLMDNLYKRSTGEEVIVRARGFAPKRVDVTSGPPDRPAEVAIALDPGHRIRGRVVDESGRPLEGVWVYFAHGRRMFSEGGRGTTDANGVFFFDSLPEVSPFSFYKQDYSAIEDRTLPLDTDAVATVVMRPAGTIVGRVVDARTGEPVGAFTVRITFSRTRQPGEPSGSLSSALEDPGLASTSGDGRFKVGGLVVDMPLQVTVSAAGYERRVLERVVVARPEAAKIQEFRLEVLDPANLRTYGGRLLDAQGVPVPGADLRLIAHQPLAGDRSEDNAFNWVLIETGQLARDPSVTRFLTATTDQQGRFRFTGIPGSSQVKLAWWGPGIPRGRADHLERTASAAAAAGSIDITLPAPARISGTVNRTAYPSAARVSAQRTDDSFDDVEQTLAAGQSDFEIRGLAPGEYWVSLMGPYERVPGQGEGITSRSLASEKVTVRPGESRRVDFAK